MLSGLPLSAATREVITTWNNTVGSVWPGMKRKTYESKKLREAYNSYAKPAGISYDTLSTAMEYVATLESDKDAEGNPEGQVRSLYPVHGPDAQPAEGHVAGAEKFHLERQGHTVGVRIPNTWGS